MEPAGSELRFNCVVDEKSEGNSCSRIDEEFNRCLAFPKNGGHAGCFQFTAASNASGLT
jgi:hypothetical protein